MAIRQAPTLGPDNATLAVRHRAHRRRAKAGHNLLIEVSAWEATLTVGEDAADTRIEVTADGGSLRVLEGTGGMQELGDDDKANIEQTIDDEVLKAERHVPLDARRAGGRRPARVRAS